MENIMNTILYIIVYAGGLAAIILMLTLTITNCRSYKEDKENREKQDKRDAEYHESRMKALEKK